MRTLRPLTAAFVALGVGVVAAPAGAAEVHKLSFRVPVRTPDATGAAVTLDTDVYLPAGRAPRRGRPLVEVFHGGGSEKANPFDAGHARYFARHGYVALIYSQRGHGDSGGRTAVAGPDEMRDLFDVTAWALRQGFGIDRRRIGLTGYSQGGLSTNLAQAYASDRSINPGRIRFAALEPGNTPDFVAPALAPNGVDKLSVGLGLIETYGAGTRARVSPLFGKWLATLGADALYAQGASLCDTSVHDTATSPTLNDLAARSVGCFARRITPPVMWAQAFDDVVFPSDMAVAMLRRLPRPSTARLYLDMGGHAAPAADAAVERDKLRAQLAFFDHALRGRPLRLPRVVYWTRDPAVRVAADAYRYPPHAWVRHTARRWPPPSVRPQRYALGAGGALAPAASEGTVALSGPQADPQSDSVVQTGFAATPLGTSPLAATSPAAAAPGTVASFATAPFPRAREVSGPVGLALLWTPSSPDTQLAAKVYDRAPDGTLTLLARGVTGLRGALPGEARTLRFSTNDLSVLVRAGHALVLTVAAGDATFYKPYADSAPGGTLSLGPASTATLPLAR